MSSPRLTKKPESTFHSLRIKKQQHVFDQLPRLFHRLANSPLFSLGAINNYSTKQKYYNRLHKLRGMNKNVSNTLTVIGQNQTQYFGKIIHSFDMHYFFIQVTVRPDFETINERDLFNLCLR